MTSIFFQLSIFFSGYTIGDDENDSKSERRFVFSRYLFHSEAIGAICLRPRFLKTSKKSDKCMFVFGGCHKLVTNEVFQIHADCCATTTLQGVEASAPLSSG